MQCFVQSSYSSSSSSSSSSIGVFNRHVDGLQEKQQLIQADWANLPYLEQHYKLIININNNQ